MLMLLLPVLLLMLFIVLLLFVLLLLLLVVFLQKIGRRYEKEDGEEGGKPWEENSITLIASVSHPHSHL